MAPGAATRFTIERLNASARAFVASHFLALPPGDRYLRFGTAASAPRVAAYVDRIDFGRDAVLAVRAEPVGAALTGIAHAAFEDGLAEVGVSVLPAHRGQGMGRALLECAVAHARSRGMRRLWMQFLPGNAAIIGLARRLGMRIVSCGLDACAELELPASATKETIPA
jgi:GNAT superfamily N-acetyltransferase